MSSLFCECCRKKKAESAFSNWAVKKKVSCPTSLLACISCTQPPDTSHLSVEDQKRVVQEHVTKLSKWRSTNGQVTGIQYQPHGVSIGQRAHTTPQQEAEG